MIPEKISAVAGLYIEALEEQHVSPQRISLDIPLRDAKTEDLLAHALYLANNVSTYIAEGKIGKANRHLAALQMILSFTGAFTIRELMSHNKS